MNYFKKSLVYFPHICYNLSMKFVQDATRKDVIYARYDFGGSEPLFEL